ncbi:type II CRISPR-associated endonuclease Cas1 [Fructilactobacillus fructivorans]|uniref:CRISPR-associated endonuclease Cas1 n=1 Tax=Fructilactobacillus fructivorans TaxID=1614 RepID=A0A0C1Q362_9LACO|nr:type II CRISPR-associated endonuclease Cas1 [Fructilactobacillus fructivorans]KID42263.1 CRISPR-associated protein Cas1 [Fructilactobacillus fructivorans]MCT0151114.1 type II CRISPR-associated endonuclease Cas1 [Fructilactobacillus fructivorans]MCT2867328.1 type II CRISPR-associated endonuclease Cas1 [Fructilactobacillus fructivorans]MCT2869153.1 type II CRISPR-associated endonuclease Cas1 [Fructilactobacillus fructivorans]MCT2873127.1 type II CRISPR-associated endonuclease Cas1 [Fructilact
MAWRSVVITQHSKISYSGRRIIVQTDSNIHEIPVEDIEVLLISTTQAVVTARAMAELSRNAVKVIFSDTLGEPVCETVNYLPNNRTLSLLKNQFNWDAHRKEILWTWIATAKMKMQIEVLQSKKIDTEELDYEFKKIEVNDETNREAVVARKYFPMLFGTDFQRRDFSPYNAALNYGYSLLLSFVNRSIVEQGYLTQIGIHHHSDENQFNLGSDLMEPFRPIIDGWVSGQDIKKLTPEVKIQLVDLFNLELKFNGKNTILRNALKQHVNNCLKYLSQEQDDVKIEVELKDEVSSNEINRNV